jgi:hypothetical protein
MVPITRSRATSVASIASTSALSTPGGPPEEKINSPDAPATVKQAARFTQTSTSGSIQQPAVATCKGAPQLMTPLMDGLSHMGDGMIDAWSESYGRWDGRCMVSDIWAMG